MTTYVVLKKDQSELWQELTAQVATSPRAAIRQVIQKTNESGVYVAVPARSWVKQTVALETKQAVRFS